MPEIRDHLSLFINGQHHEVRGSDALLTLSDYLREGERLTGTKIVCAEGDCGACTVLIGRDKGGGELEYLPINSCIQFMFQLEGAHVVTVEGITPDEGLHGVQQAMVDCHGSQCGFCTPGFVMTLCGMFEAKDRSASENGAAPSTGKTNENDLAVELSGNLCRCTGYVQIEEAARSVDAAGLEPVTALFSSAQIKERAQALSDQDVKIPAEGGNLEAFIPASLESALAYKAEYPDAIVVSGATDIGVQVNKGIRSLTRVLCLQRLRELAGVSTEDGNLTVGALASWSTVLAAVEEKVPEYFEILQRFGAPQIRHSGTMGGNMINASPIADSIPFHYVMEATLEVASEEGTRQIPINDFYTDYKQFDLKPNELLTKITTPIPKDEDLLGLYKVSRRRDLDISTFTAAIWIELEGDMIKGARLAYGGVGPTVIRLKETEANLIGKPFTLETLEAAGEIAASEISPLSDVRGSREYRLQLAKNILLKFYHEKQTALKSSVAA